MILIKNILTRMGITSHPTNTKTKLSKIILVNEEMDANKSMVPIKNILYVIATAV